MIVLDANVAVEAARGTESGLALLELVLEDEQILAPGIFHAEVANSFWSYVHAGMLESSSAIPLSMQAEKFVDEFIPDEALLPEALQEAAHCNHPVYDMLYVVLARRNGATLVTRDKKLLALCDSLGISRVHDVNLGG